VISFDGFYAIVISFSVFDVNFELYWSKYKSEKITVVN